MKWRPVHIESRPAASVLQSPEGADCQFIGKARQIIGTNGPLLVRAQFFIWKTGKSIGKVVPPAGAGGPAKGSHVKINGGDGRETDRAARKSSTTITEGGGDLLHPLAVDPEVLTAQAGGGTEVDALGGVVEDELDVVHEMEDCRTAFRLEVVRLLADDPRPGMMA